MSNYVNREKYEIVKEKASQWRDKALDYKGRYENILEENEKLMVQNDELEDKIDNTHESRKIEQVPDAGKEQEISDLKKEIKSLNKKIRMSEDKHAKEHFDLERQLLRKEGEADRLNASLDDYKERYKEVRDEIRQMRGTRMQV